MSDSTEALRTRTKRNIATHAVALAVGALLALSLSPKPAPKIEYREREKIVTVEKTDEIEKWKALYNEEHEKKSKVNVVTKTVTIEKPTGEKVTTIDSTSTTDTQEQSHVGSSSEGSKEVVRVVEKEVFRDVVVKQDPVLPNWMVTGMVGARPALPPSVIYGGMVQRRLVGPVWVGAWGTTSPDAGISLSVEF